MPWFLILLYWVWGLASLHNAADFSQSAHGRNIMRISKSALPEPLAKVRIAVRARQGRLTLGLAGFPMQHCLGGRQHSQAAHGAQERLKPVCARLRRPRVLLPEAHGVHLPPLSSLSWSEKGAPPPLASPPALPPEGFSCNHAGHLSSKAGVGQRPAVSKMVRLSVQAPSASRF